MMPDTLKLSEGEVKELVAAFKSAAKRDDKNIFVVSYYTLAGNNLKNSASARNFKKHWAVKLESEKETLRTFKRKDRALHFAKSLLAKGKGKAIKLLDKEDYPITIED